MNVEDERETEGGWLNRVDSDSLLVGEGGGRAFLFVTNNFLFVTPLSLSLNQHLYVLKLIFSDGALRPR